MAEHTLPYTASESAKQPKRLRLGLNIQNEGTVKTIERIKEAEAAGVEQVWMTQSPTPGDTLMTLALAGAQTQRIRLGTSIIPIFPRNPLAMVLETVTINDVVPGRFRLGIGPSHRPIMEKVYGVHFSRPLEHLREYTTIVRTALNEGSINYDGNNYHIHAQLPSASPTPVLISALGEQSFRLAGQVADGAISWLCPVPYLLKTSLPALQQGAQEARRPTPPLVAHVIVAMSDDRAAIQDVAQKRLQGYTTLPFYRNMFEAAGFPLGKDNAGFPALIDELVISGTDQQVAERLDALLTQGVDELLIMQVPVKDEEKELQQLMRIIGSM